MHCADFVCTFRYAERTNSMCVPIVFSKIGFWVLLESKLTVWGPSMGFPSLDLGQVISTKISQPGDLSQMISAQWSPTCAWKQNLDNMTCRVAVQEEVLVATVVFLCSSSNYLFIAQSICVPIVLKRMSSDLCWGIQRLTMPSAAFWV